MGKVFNNLLKKKDLEKDKHYTCILGGHTMLITKISENKDLEIYSVEALYYSKATGKYEYVDVEDDMLYSFEDLS